MKARGIVKKDLKHATAMPGPGPVETKFKYAENPDMFVSAGLNCFTLIGWAVLVATAGALALDGAALAPVFGLEDGADLGFVDAGLALCLIALAMLASIQVRYTFEHADIHREHYYALKLARWREATAALRSLAVADASAAVEKLIDLRVETALLDRRLAIEAVKLQRRWRDLSMFPMLAAVGGLLAVLLVRASGAGPAIAGAVLWSLTFLWAGERVRRVREVLEIAPDDLNAMFNPTPALKATVVRLLTRINRHFDRLKGAAELADAAIEEEEAGS
jgi:hypothetical protein